VVGGKYKTFLRRMTRSNKHKKFENSISIFAIFCKESFADDIIDLTLFEKDDESMKTDFIILR
jgi:hypothetical protein